MTRSLAILAVVMVNIPDFAWAGAEDHFHVRERTGYSSEPVSSARIDKIITESALRYQKYGAVAARVGFHDIAFPKDSKEFHRLNGYGLLVVTAISQDSSEIPLRRVYVQGEHGQEVLQRLFSISSAVEPPDGAVTQIFGPFRADAMYLFPVHCRFKDSKLLTDFAQNRRGFHLATFPERIPSALKALPKEKPTSIPPLEEIRQFAHREYPDLGRLLVEVQGESSKED